MDAREIKRLRKEKQMTQIETAIACKVGIATYRLWELGGTRPNEVNKKRLEEVLLGGEHAENNNQKHV